MNSTIKNTMRKWLGMGGILLALGLPAASVAQTVLVPLTTAEHGWLTYMCEEEKVARDAYLTFYEQWGFRAFQNIAKSEQTHLNALKKMLARYGLPDPAVDDTIGVFSNPELKALYDELVAQGGTSLVDALGVGVLIEETDIDDLGAAMAVTTHRDLLTVYKNLLKGSNNHLKAFTTSLTRASQTPVACTGTATARVCTR